MTTANLPITNPVETSQSAAFYERALKILPGGVSRNAALHDPHPLYVDKGEGCRLSDVEGVQQKIVDIVRSLEESGQLARPGNDGEEEFVA